MTYFGFILLPTAYLAFQWELIKRFFAPVTPEIIPVHQNTLADHAHYRRFTAKYRRKRSIVKSLWISAGLMSLMFPFLQFVCAMGLFTTCLSFAILDETA